MKKHQFLTVLEAGKSKPKVPTGLLSSEDSFIPWFRDGAFPLCPHRAERAENTNKMRLPHSQGLYPHDLAPSQRPHLQTRSHWILVSNPRTSRTQTFKPRLN